MSLENLSLENFLKNNRISQDDWAKADIKFEKLKEIAIDHSMRAPNLDDAASHLAKILQKCPQVHSVRWRVKNPEHVIEKIVRKRVLKSKKYLTITLENYTEVLTDLVGVRVLHLFKYEWLDIQAHILNHWQTEERPVAYIRAGDEGEIVESYKTNSCDVKNHPAGYRSIHYVISTQPTIKKILSEIQVRTIFEEGWSEIDHEIRYPNFSDNELVSYFLTIFNRMAGSADEMGTFVRSLTSEMVSQEQRIDEISQEREQQVAKIKDLTLELSSVKNNNAEKLNQEVAKLAEMHSAALSSTYASKIAESFANSSAVKLANSMHVNQSAVELARLHANSSAAKLARAHTSIFGNVSEKTLKKMERNALTNARLAAMAASSYKKSEAPSGNEAGPNED